MRLNKRALLLLAAIPALFFNAPSVLAAVPVNLEISPLPILLNTNPGTTAGADLRVRNVAAEPVTLKASIKTFQAEGNDGHIVFHDPAPAEDFVKWVSFSKNDFIAPPGEWQTVHMSVAVPKDAAFGYYFAVQFAPEDKASPTPGAANVKGAVAIFVLLNADSPGAKRSLQISSFTADHRSYEFLPAGFTVQLHNNGNVHVAPHGNIFIKHGNKQIASLQVNSAGGYVLPASNRIYTAAWSDGFPVYVPSLGADSKPLKDKDGKPKMHLSWDLSRLPKLRFGHYTADLLLVYNDGQRDVPLNASVSFWVVPWRIMAVLFIVLVLMGIGSWSIFKKGTKVIKRRKRTDAHDS
jgi:hypothetical protein